MRSGSVRVRAAASRRRAFVVGGTPIRIATRGSKLALWQAEHVRGLLAPLAGERPIELVTVVSTGDAVRDRPLHELGGAGLFTKEVQEAVLSGAADIAVHSLKDLPTQPAPGLRLAAVPPRGPAGDAFLSGRAASLAHLPPGATVATSSLRRRAMLLRARPDLLAVDVRGNVETRIRKLDEGAFDALVLAEAGLVRLDLESRITERLDASLFLSAAGQGALGIECREDDREIFELLQSLDDPQTRQATTAERGFLAALRAGCQAPVGAAASVERGVLCLRGAVLTPDGRSSCEGTAEGFAHDAERIGQELAATLIASGADQILDAAGGPEPQRLSSPFLDS